METNVEIAQMIDELVITHSEAGLVDTEEIILLTKAAIRLRDATEPEAGIRAVYEKWEHRDRDGTMSNWNGYPPGEEMFYEFWVAIKAAVEGGQDDT